ncbi:MAG: RNA polymerase sigma factor [Amphiplicatus sp.]
MRASELSVLLENEIAPLCRFALLLTKSYDDAEDLAQDTMERALIKAHLFDGANLRSWLFTVCQRIFLNRVRREKARGMSVELDDAPLGALSADGGQEEMMTYKRTAECIARLPERDQRLLSLIALHGARYEDAARETGAPVGTVRSRLSRARARLKEMVDSPKDAGALAPAGNG